MNENNNVNLEGIVIECSLDTLPSSDIKYASMIISTTHKKKGGSAENAYHRVRFPVSPDTAESIVKLKNDCKQNFEKISRGVNGVAPRYISLNGELRHDKRNQPFILADEKDVRFPEKISNKNNRISLEGKLHSILHSSPVAATLLIKVPNGEKNKSLVPVIIDSRKNPLEWAAIASGKTAQGDNVRVTGRLDGKLYGNGPNNDMLLRSSILSQTISIKNNLKKQNQQKPVLPTL